MWIELDDFYDLLKQNSIEYEALSPNEVETYKQVWFRKFVPVDKQETALDIYCFDGDGYCGYLWHVFSYELLDSITDDEAKKSFDNMPKQQAVILVNIEDVALRIKDISKLKADDFEMIQDVIVTDIDFRWTYVKTHEEMCGPYFHKNPTKLL